MKTLIKNLFVLMLLIPFMASAQFTDNGTYLRTDDNVNIGTNSNIYSLYVRKDKSGWQGRFANRAGAGSDVYFAHGAGNGMHVRGGTTGNQYTLELKNSNARTNIFYNNGKVGLGLVGNVGIGTASPSQKLEVAGNVYSTGWIKSTSGKLYFGDVQKLYGNKASALYYDSNHSTVTQLVFRDKEAKVYGKIYGSGNGINFGLRDGDGHWSYLAEKDSRTVFKINNQDKMVLHNNGRVNISSTRDASGTPGSGALEIGNGLRLDNNEIITNTNSVLNINRDNNGDVAIDDQTFRVIASQNCVKIGSASTVAFNDYKLFVEKGILTEKVKVAVKSSSDWSDYVFEEDYTVMPIDKLEDYVTKNKHLPNVPSAEEVVKNGLDVATMDAKLLEKIEEAHLYIIELHKEIEKMKTQINNKQ